MQLLTLKTKKHELLIFLIYPIIYVSRFNDGLVVLHSIEINGEKLHYKDCEYNLLSHPNNTFTQEEYEYFRDKYFEIIN